MPTLNLTADTTEVQITADILQTLKSAQSNGKPVFGRVQECDSPENFIKYSQITGDAVCGIQVERGARDYGMSNAEDFDVRMCFNLAIGKYYSEPPNGDFGPVVEVVTGLIDLTRQALLADPYRSGLASVIMWHGKILPGTDVNSQPKPIKRVTNPNAKYQDVPFVAFVLPVYVAYTIAAD